MSDTEQLQAALTELEPVLAAGGRPVRMSESGELTVNRLSAEDVPNEVETSLQLVDLLPRPQFIELLTEVDRWADWSNQLTRAGSKTHREPQPLRRDPGAGLHQPRSVQRQQPVD